MNMGTSANTNSSSDIPGFESVSMENLKETTLISDDLGSRKKQLWLIKVPYEFDVSQLSGKTVLLQGSQDFTVKQDQENNGKSYESRASKYQKDEPCQYKVVIPSKTKGGLNVAKDFTGHMDIIQSVKVPMLTYPPAPPSMYTDIPEGLKPRWKPFGHRAPPKIGKRKVSKSEESKVGEKRERDEERESKSPKKKKKKTKTNESGYGSSMQLNDSSSSTKRKKKKKRNS